MKMQVMCFSKKNEKQKSVFTSMALLSTNLSFLFLRNFLSYYDSPNVTILTLASLHLSKWTQLILLVLKSAALYINFFSCFSKVHKWFTEEHIFQTWFKIGSCFSFGHLGICLEICPLDYYPEAQKDFLLTILYNPVLKVNHYSIIWIIF